MAVVSCTGGGRSRCGASVSITVKSCPDGLVGDAVAGLAVDVRLDRPLPVPSKPGSRLLRVLGGCGAPSRHAVFWVTPRSAASCTDDRPFGFATIKKIASSHV